MDFLTPLSLKAYLSVVNSFANLGRTWTSMKLTLE